MPLPAGTTLGPYEILAPLGAGGMGEVYRARDSKLGRDVALKVLPAAVADDPERLARLQREAQVLASLNHPNIAHIYGLESRALVMELVEGPTLAERIAAGPLPLDEALPIARQIAEALEAAHEKGIVHRDLKPANIKVTPQGLVKVLDFGLAKALEDSPASGELANSPTLSLAATKAGIILGTAAYMSPEQAKGKPVDRRADIWAFGVVLHEMLTGRQMYASETVSETLASVLLKEPALDTLPASTPWHIRQLLERCLRKDPRSRLRDIGEARVVLEEAPRSPVALPAAVRQSAIFSLQSAIAAVFALVAIVALAMLWKATRPAPLAPLQRFHADLGLDTGQATSYGAATIISPDGTRLAFVARGADGRSRIHTRLLEQSQASPLAGTENARSPFFSPDGQWVAFFADGKLKKISVQGGTAVTLCDAADDRGGSWGEDGQIVFTPNTRSGLLRVSDAGGAPTLITELSKDRAESTHRWPQVLPGSGGQAVLFVTTAAANYEEANIEAQSLNTGQRKMLHRGGTYGRYLPSGRSPGTGHLVYVQQGTLFAAPMDLSRLELIGPFVPVVEEVVVNTGNGGAQFAFSQTGIFVFQTGKATGAVRIVAWLDSAGKTQPLRHVPGRYFSPRFSPDGKRLALASAEGGNMDIWVYEWERDTASRLTFTAELEQNPVWSPDGKHIAFQSFRNGPGNIYWMRADGGGDTVRLTESKNNQGPYSISPDGKRLAFFEQSPETGSDIWTLPLDLTDPDHPKPGKPELFLRTPFIEVTPVFSPDGRWLAYMSLESGGPEVYVRPFPGPGGKWQVSTGGGVMPVWPRNGRELFYRTLDNRLMVANYTAKGEAFAADKPRLWSEKRFLDTGTFTNFDPAPDGKRFAVLMAPEGDAEQQRAKTHVTFLLNFFDELRRKVPGKQ